MTLSSNTQASVENRQKRKNFIKPRSAQLPIFTFSLQPRTGAWHAMRPRPEDSSCVPPAKRRFFSLRTANVMNELSYSFCCVIYWLVVDADMVLSGWFVIYLLTSYILVLKLTLSSSSVSFSQGKHGQILHKIGLEE